MNARKALLFLALALGISVLPDLFPKFWSASRSPDQIRYIGSLAPYQAPCRERFEAAECRIQYNLPSSFLRNSIGKLHNSLGLGYFLTDYAIRCDDRLVYSPGTEFSPSRVIESYKTYKVVDLAALDCDDARTISVLALNRRGLPTHGQFSANAAVGDRDHVAALKRTIEFLTSGSYLVFAILLLFTLFARKILLRPLISAKEETESGLRYSAAGFGLFSLLKSGIFEVFFLTPTSIDLIFRIQSAISLYSHAYPSIQTDARNQKERTTRYSLLGSLMILYAIMAVTTQYVNFLVYAVLSACGFGLIRMALRKNWDSALLVYTFCAVCECLKTFEIKPLPAGSTTVALVTCLQVHYTVQAIRSAGIIAAANIWARRWSGSASPDAPIREILGSFSRESGIRRVSFFLLQRSGDHLLFTFDTDIESEEAFRHINIVPSILGHVIATGDPLLHQNTADDFSVNLLQRKPILELGDYYSVIPVKDANGLIGVVALSKYDFVPARSSTQRTRMEAYAHALTEILAIASERRAFHLSDRRFDQISAMLNEVSQCPGPDSLAAFADRLVHAFRGHFNWSAFFAVYNEQIGTLDIMTHSFPLSEGGAELTGTRWQMKRENVRGPAPVALFQGRRMLVPNMKWVAELVSDDTKRFQRASHTESMAVLPVRRKSANERAAFGVLWISSSVEGTFDSTFERCAHLLQESIESEIHRRLQDNLANTFLNTQVRPDISERILRGESPREEGIGTLVQVDLIKSTPISNSVGADRWKQYQSTFLAKVKSAAQSYGLTPEMFVWDAIYLTHESPLPAEELKQFTIECLRITEDLARSYGVSDLLPDPTRCARICATFGDITREVQNGTWTVNGHLIASLSKLEQAMKRTEFSLSVAPTLYERWNSPEGLIGVEVESIRAFVFDPAELRTAA